MGRLPILLVAGCLVACGGKDTQEDTATDTLEVVDTAEEEATLPDTCESSSDCDDGDPCSGTETCDTDTNTCHWGSPLPDGEVCSGDPRSICLRGRCRESVCGDGYVDRAGGEFCEPSTGGDCIDCSIVCTESTDCLDEDMCNGAESCNTTTHLCEAGTPTVNGTLCDSPPRQICLYGECVESLCGDGFIDSVGGERCEGATSQDCTTECGVDGTQACNSICRWTECAAPPPANDACADAPALSGSMEGTTCSATNDWVLAPSCGEGRAPDVFYALTVPADGDVTVSTCASTGFDTVIAIFEGTCDEATEVACNDDAPSCGDGSQSSVTATLTAGEYIVIVDGNQVGTGAPTEGFFTIEATLP
jgi:hypothetical protein